MAKLYGGPASGLEIPDGSDDLVQVATALNDHGGSAPEVEDGQAVVQAEEGDDPPRRRWECYRRVGVVIPELQIDPRDDLPIPTGEAYRWVCRRKPS